MFAILFIKSTVLALVAPNDINTLVVLEKDLIQPNVSETKKTENSKMSDNNEVTTDRMNKHVRFD